MQNREGNVVKLRNEIIKIHGKAWNTQEATELFEFIAFCAPFVEVRRKYDDKRGTLTFTDRPRFYFNFVEISK